MAIAGLTVGNIAQYVTEDATCAAIIVKVHDAETGRVDLIVFLTNFGNGSIGKIETSRIYSEDGTPGTWHWLPGVDG